MLRGFFPPAQGSVGWYDNADLATQSTPLVHVGGVDTDLTNDGLGAASAFFDPLDVGDIWDRTTNRFDFTAINVGSIMWFRASFEVTTSAVNQEFDLFFDGAIGGVVPFSIHMLHSGFKTPGPIGVTQTMVFYIGSPDTRDNPGKFRFVSADNATIKVVGWFVPILAVPGVLP